MTSVEVKAGSVEIRISRGLFLFLALLYVAGCGGQLTVRDLLLSLHDEQGRPLFGIKRYRGWRPEGRGTVIVSAESGILPMGSFYYITVPGWEEPADPIHDRVQSPLDLPIADLSDQDHIRAVQIAYDPGRNPLHSDWAHKRALMG